MVTLDLADTLTFTDGDALTVGGPLAAGVPIDDTNLVRRALRLVGRTASRARREAQLWRWGRIVFCRVCLCFSVQKPLPATERTQ